LIFFREKTEVDLDHVKDVIYKHMKISELDAFVDEFK